MLHDYRVHKRWFLQKIMLFCKIFVTLESLFELLLVGVNASLSGIIFAADYARRISIFGNSGIAGRVNPLSFTKLFFVH